MAVNTLNLPIDIPWKRICVSPDMIDRRVCDRRFPYRWRSSLAVFAYEPPEEHQEYEDLIVTYLKVSATITGFQADPNEVGIKNRYVHERWLTPEAIANYEDAVSRYYGCYGAILEVAIAPNVSREERQLMAFQKFPYFIDFQPKKRELYEIVSETGEVMSRTLEGVSVQKGTTATQSHETLDVLTGAGGSAFTVGGSASGEWGTRAITGMDYTNMRSTDESRERRETQSHTTQYSQMYHQFTAYHLGTNRAVFYMLPRPHIVQSEHTFVNGPRALEGIQDVFLVAMRPRNTEMFCVEAYLETAHIASTPIKEYRPAPTKQLHLHVPPKPPSGDDDFQFWLVNEGSEVVHAPQGQEVDLGKEQGGYKVDSLLDQYGTSPGNDWSINSYSDRVTAWGKTYSSFVEGDYDPGELDIKASVFLRYTKPEVVGYDTTLWLTGRGLCCCGREGISLRPILERPVLIREIPMAALAGTPVGRRTPMSVADANRINAEVGQQVITSIDAPDRHAFGAVDFIDAQFIANSMARAIEQEGNLDDVGVQDIPDLASTIRKRVAEADPRATRCSLLRMSLTELADRYELDDDEARSLRRASLGLGDRSSDGQDRWTPKERTVVVPDLFGLPHVAARRRLAKNRLTVGEHKTVDSPLNRDVVVEQSLAAGTNVPEYSAIDIGLASGAVVIVPDVVGMTVAQALTRLRGAGLESEPLLEVRGVQGAQVLRVKNIEPKPRSPVTPNARVTLAAESDD